MITSKIFLILLDLAHKTSYCIVVNRQAHEMFTSAIFVGARSQKLISTYTFCSIPWGGAHKIFDANIMWAPVPTTLEFRVVGGKGHDMFTSKTVCGADIMTSFVRA